MNVVSFISLTNSLFFPMNVQQMIEKLQQFPMDMEVELFDGYNGYQYKGDFQFQEFEGVVDIGIGGFLVEE
jgi:hypothetical protein